MKSTECGNGRLHDSIQKILEKPGPRFKTVKTIVRELGWADLGLQISRTLWGVFTAFSEHHQKMFTHFAHVLVDDQDKHWLVERNTHGVEMIQIDHDGSEMGQIVDCWTGIVIDNAQLVEFLYREQGLSYSIVTKNCKHFCYDFRRSLLHVEEDFFAYCQFIEGKFLAE